MSSWATAPETERVKANRLAPKSERVFFMRPILAEAESLGCDLIVKGAYTQSRLRQMIFGGTTRHIIAEANVPVLMAH